MHKIDSVSATDDNHFTEGDPTIPVPATVVTADWLNAVQEEMASVIEGAGITLNKESNVQLKDALEIMLAEWTPDATESVSGILKLATEALALAGVDDSTAMTPLKLKQRSDAVGAHFVGQWVSLRNSEPPTGYYVRTGALIENASATVPKLWAYLQEEANSEQCITQAAWTAMQAATYTLTDEDETEVPIWNGVGGVPFYVLDTEADTLRLPDTRGMYAEDSGFDGLAVGGAHGDMIRNITGRAASYFDFIGYEEPYGAFSDETHAFYGDKFTTSSSGGTAYTDVHSILDVARVVPTGNAVKPRGFGMLGCIYAG